MIVSFQKSSWDWKNFENLHLHDETFIVHKLSGPHIQRIPKAKENYAHEIHGPEEYNEGDVYIILSCLLSIWIVISMNVDESHILDRASRGHL